MVAHRDEPEGERPWVNWYLTSSNQPALEFLAHSIPYDDGKPWDLDVTERGVFCIQRDGDFFKYMHLSPRANMRDVHRLLLRSGRVLHITGYAWSSNAGTASERSGLALIDIHVPFQGPRAMTVEAARRTFPLADFALVPYRNIPGSRWRMTTDKPACRSCGAAWIEDAVYQTEGDWGRSDVVRRFTCTKCEGLYYLGRGN